MSDFVSPGWGWFVGGATLLSLLACLWLLKVASRRKIMAKDNTTGHVWDEDLRELNNPLPRWWMGLFIIMVVFGALYLVLYPGLGFYQGLLGWSQVGAYEQDVERANERLEPLYARFMDMDEKALAADPQAQGIGERLYVNWCAQCHGSDARGSRGFPNLTDGDWQWGGGLDDIKTTIAEGRHGVMPPMAAAVGSATDVRNLAHYVLSLSGSPHNSLQAQLGRQHFATCAACHGADGTGNTALGAPNLTDRIWVHGWGEAAIVRAITQGIDNRMPGHADKLTEQQIHVLAGYVWGLSNRQSLASAP